MFNAGATYVADVSRLSKVIGVHSQHASLLRELTYHVGSHSVTCHPAEVTFPPLHHNIFTVLLFCWQCCLLILYIVFCCLHCDCLGLAAIKWFLTAFETLNLLTYLLTPATQSMVLNSVTPEGHNAELACSWLTYISRWYTHVMTVTHPGTNWAKRRVTSFYATNDATSYGRARVGYLLDIRLN